MSTTDYKTVKLIATNDVQTLEVKGLSYGDSWKRRGGCGAFMMLARKWDRIENQCSAEGYDIFKLCVDQADSRDGILDDIRDLRCYLLLVEAEVVALTHQQEQARMDVAMRGYVDQD